MGDGLEEGRWERLSAVGMSPETGPGHWADDDEGASVSKNGNLFELLHYWENGRHAILINRHTLAYDGANPYWRKEALYLALNPCRAIYGILRSLSTCRPRLTLSVTSV